MAGKCYFCSMMESVLTPGFSALIILDLCISISSFGPSLVPAVFLSLAEGFGGQSYSKHFPVLSNIVSEPPWHMFFGHCMLGV